MEEDRISQLPDEILQHILSFIDIYEAVETTILSKRWKHLWRSLPGLRFHLSRAAAHRHVPLKKEQHALDFTPRFSRFVSGFLSHRDPTAPVRDFHLSFDGPSQAVTEVELVEECGLYAVRHGIESFRLHAPYHLKFLRLPAALFASSALRELELRELYCMLYVPERFSLPNLKTLYLESVLFFGIGEVKHYGIQPFQDLPELERLSLRDYPIDRLDFKAPKLRVLDIFHYSPLGLKAIEEISAPSLTSFSYESNLPFECSNVSLPMLEDVHLDIYDTRANMQTMHQKCVTMLQQFGNATTVSLTLDTLKFLEPLGNSKGQTPPPFHNIKCLKVMEGRQENRNYIETLMQELPHGVTVVQQNFND